MAKIPRIEQVGEYQPSRDIVQGVRTPVNDGIARGLQDLGKATTELADRLYKADTDKKIVEASRKTREDLDRAYRDITESSDILPEDYEKHYREESDRIISANAEMVPSGGRDMWRERALGWQSDAVIRTRDVTRQRQVDKARAGIVAETEAIGAQVGDLSLSEKTVADNIAGQRGLIDRQVREGIIDEEAGARLQAQLTEMALKDVTIRVTSNIDELVQNGQVAEARAQFMANYKRIDPATRAAIEKGLDASEFDNRVVTESDRLWTEAKGDYGRFIKEAGKVSDARLRVKIEERGAQLQRQADAAENARQDNLERSMWAHVEKGGTIGNAPASLRGAIDPDRLGSIRAYENARDAENGMNGAQKAAWSAASSGWRNELESAAAMPASTFMQDPSKWSPRDRAKFEALTPTDQNAIRAKQADMRDRGNTQDEVSKIEGQLLDVAKVVADPKWGLRSNANNRPAESEKLLGELRGQAAMLAKENGGRPLTPDQVRYAVALAMKAAGESKSDFVSWNTFAMRVDPAFAENVADTMEYEQAFNDLRAAGDGVDPTFEEVQELLATRRGAP